MPVEVEVGKDKWITLDRNTLTNLHNDQFTEGMYTVGARTLSIVAKNDPSINDPVVLSAYLIVYASLWKYINGVNYEDTLLNAQGDYCVLKKNENIGIDKNTLSIAYIVDEKIVTLQRSVLLGKINRLRIMIDQYTMPIPEYTIVDPSPELAAAIGMPRRPNAPAATQVSESDCTTGEIIGNGALNLSNFRATGFTSGSERDMTPFQRMPSLSSYPVKLNSIAQIDRLFTQTVQHNRAARGSVAIVISVDAYELPRSRLAENSVLQVASQFNFLESPGRNYSPISEYPQDYTQGPRASLAVPVSLAMRDASFANEKDPNKSAFSGINHLYMNGYLELSSLQHSTHIDPAELKLCVQDGYERHTGKLVTQVFCAAPSFQGFSEPAPGSYAYITAWDLIAMQYKAIAQIAYIKSVITQKKTRLHLTLIGGGAFNNPLRVVLTEVMRCALTASSLGIDVYIHVWRPDDKMINEIMVGYGEIPIMTMNQFFAE